MLITIVSLTQYVWAKQAKAELIAQIHNIGNVDF